MTERIRIEKIIERLTDLGAEFENSSGSSQRIKVTFAFSEKVSSKWIEIGFLLGQWCNIEGVDFPSDFPEGELALCSNPSFRFDVDPAGMNFIFH